jgi:hypothetical protein
VLDSPQLLTQQQSRLIKPVSMAGGVDSNINGFYSNKFDKKGGPLSDSAVYSPRDSINGDGSSSDQESHSDAGREVSLEAEGLVQQAGICMAEQGRAGCVAPLLSCTALFLLWHMFDKLSSIAIPGNRHSGT